MEELGLRRAAARAEQRFGQPLLSVYAAELPFTPASLPKLVESAPLLAQRRQVCLSTPGRIRGAGFDLLPTFDAPHYSLGVLDLEHDTMERLRAGFDAPLLNPTSTPPSPDDALGLPSNSRARQVTEDASRGTTAVGGPERHRREWLRGSTVREAEPGVVVEAGAEVLAGNDEGDLWRMRVVSVDAEGWVRLDFVGTITVAPVPTELSAVVRTSG